MFIRGEELAIALGTWAKQTGRGSKEGRCGCVGRGEGEKITSLWSEELFVSCIQCDLPVC